MLSKSKHIFIQVTSLSMGPKKAIKSISIKKNLLSHWTYLMPNSTLSCLQYLASSSSMTSAIEALANLVIMSSNASSTISSPNTVAICSSTTQNIMCYRNTFAHLHWRMPSTWPPLSVQILWFYIHNFRDLNVSWVSTPSLSPLPLWEIMDVPLKYYWC